MEKYPQAINHFLYTGKLMQTLKATNRFLWMIVLTPGILYFGEPILVPLCFGMLFAMLMTPLCTRLDTRMNRSMSSLLCTIIVLISLSIIMGIIIWQLTSLVEQFPAIRKQLGKLLISIQQLIQESFSVDAEKLNRFVQSQRTDVIASTGHYLRQLIESVSTTIVTLLLSAVFTFLFLYGKERYETFFVKLYKEQDPVHIRSIVKKVSLVAEQYLLGRVYTILILFVMYVIGLPIIGVENAILLSAICALLSIIPYVGNTLATIFSVLMVLITEDGYSAALWTGGLMVFIHSVDDYFIEPYIVGSNVNLSALSTIVIIICGGLLWGIPGTILFIPMLAIVKIICDHVESIQPYGYLIGDPDNKRPGGFRLWLLKKTRKPKPARIKNGA